MERLLNNMGNIKISAVISRKDNNLANKLKVQGNKLLNAKFYYQALAKYNESLCKAEPSSDEMGYAYANRSIVYLSLERNQFDDCRKVTQLAIENIKLAINNGYPIDKQEKLLQRLKACELKLIEESKKKLPMYEADHEFKLSYEANPKVPQLAKCLELKQSDAYGHHIVTNRKLFPGDVIAIDEFFVHSINAEIFNDVSCGDNMYFVVCAYCLKNNELNLIPCAGCNHTMYCSTECQQKASAEYHELECKLFDTLVGNACMLVVRSFFKALSICNGNIEELQRLIKTLDNNNSPRMTIFDCDFTNLIGNELKRKLLLIAYSGAQDDKDRSEKMEAIQKWLRNYSQTSAMMKTHGKFIMKFITRLEKIEEINSSYLYKKLPHLEKFQQVLIGSAYCLALSLFNHSCAPNVIRVQYKKTNVLVANQVIQAGEQIFDNYGFLFATSIMGHRQGLILLKYGFFCECVACKNSYKLFNYLANMNDQPAFDARIQISLVESAEKMSGLSLHQMADMIADCTKKLRNIDNANRKKFDNRPDVLFLQQLLKMLLSVPDANGLTIRDFERFVRNGQYFTNI